MKLKLVLDLEKCGHLNKWQDVIEALVILEARVCRYATPKSGELGQIKLADETVIGYWVIE